MGRYGLKAVGVRRDDALSKLGWDRLEALLADHYRDAGYRVEHVGTGGTQRRFDGGIDLKLFRQDQYIIVQCKHWNVFKVPHNDVHQLIGLMVNQGATGAILVTSGEFTKAAVEAAGRLGHVDLVDGDDLREMLGPLQGLDIANRDKMSPDDSASRNLALNAAHRLLTAAEDRIRHGGTKRVRDGLVAGALVGPILKLAFVCLALLIGSIALPAVIRTAFRPLAEPTPRVQTAVRPAVPIAKAKTSSPSSRTPSAAPAPLVADVPRTEEELREWKKRNEESMKILEASTPEY